MKPVYFTLAMVLAGTLVGAQDYPGPQGAPPQAGQQQEAPPGPGRGVGRISVMNGEVSVRRGDSGEVTAAAINAPVGAGDTVLTSSAARAEVEFDGASLARIAANSEVRMGDLQYHRNQVQVALGLVTFTVLRNSQAQNEIDTPNVAVHPKGPGAYRVLVRDDGTSEVTVRGGEADVSTPSGSQVVKSGQTMMVRGSADQAEFQIVNAAQMDDWDRWNAERDQQLMRSTSTKYVNPDVYGAEDLDANGRWVNDGSNGMVWAPNVAPDWAPYRNGRWVWVDDYGWSWVGYEPWGWAPYHYGRWYRAGFGWAWWPGPSYGPCYWSPALVGFFGWGSGVGFGFGFGNVGWVPLAPYEVFHPWWGHGYVRNTVIVNNVNIYNTYRNARVNGGVTGVAAGSFGRTGGRFTGVNGNEIRSAGMVRGALPVTPERSSLRFSDRSVNMSNFRQSQNTQFFSRSGSTSQVRSTPFEQQRQSVQQSAGQRFGGGGQATGQRFGGGQSPAAGGSGFNGSRAGNLGGSPAVAPQSGRTGGWTRFNGPSSSGGQSQAAPQNSGRGYNAPNSGASNGYSGRSYSGSPYSGGGNNSVRISPPIVRDRAPQTSAPSYSGRSYSAPSYSAPRSAPSYNAPSYSAPRGGGGGGGSYSGGGGRSNGGGGGGGHASGGGGGHSGGGGGGGGHHR